MGRGYQTKGSDSASGADCRYYKGIMTYSEDQIDNARGLPWSSEDKLEAIDDFLRSPEVAEIRCVLPDDIDLLHEAKVRFIERRRPR